MTHLEEKHPLAIRWLHWVSFPFLFLMIWSGLLIYWANDVYRIGWGDHVGQLLPGTVLHSLAYSATFSGRHGAPLLLYVAVCSEWPCVRCLPGVFGRVAQGGTG